MAKGKKFLDLLLAKGDKLALGVAAGGLGLLGIWGVTTAVGADSPADVVKKLKDGTASINNKMQDPNGKPPDLPGWVDAKDSFKLLPADQYAAKYTAFEPVDTPDRRRENPKVLGIVDAQLDLVRVPIKAFDIKINPADNSAQIGVMQSVKVGTNDAAAMKDAFSGRAKRIGQAPRAGQPPAGMGGMPGMGGGMPGMGGRGGRGQGGGGMPGMGGGMPGMGGGGMPGMGEGSPDAGMGGGMGMPGMGGMGGMGMGFDPNGERMESVVSYKPAAEFDITKDTPAFTVYPLRTIVVHAAFPLKEQLELVRRAMRLKTVEEAAQVSAQVAGPGQMGPGPIFDGVEVQRQITNMAGKSFDWEPYDHVARYEATVYNRKVSDVIDGGYLPLFLRPDQMMATPLPSYGEELANPYPDVRMKPIVDTVKKMQAARKPPPTRNQIADKFSGKGAGAGNNPFAPVVGAGGGAAAGGRGGMGNFLGGEGGGSGIDMDGRGGMMPGGMGGRGGRGMPGMQMPGGGMPGPGGMPGMPGPGGMPMPGGMPGPGGMGSPDGGGEGMMPGGRGGMPGMPGMGGMYGGGMYGGGMYGQPNIAAPIDGSLDHLVIRFLDVDVNPGFTYQYKVRVKMKNPNYDPGNKRKLVARPDDAGEQFLFGPWVLIGTRVTVPVDSNMYAYDPVKYAEDTQNKFKDPAVQNLLTNRGGSEPVVQIQQWLPEVRFEGTKREPVGAWVVAELPVVRGEFLNRRTLVELPLWSSEKLNYVLQQLSGKFKVKGAKDQPKGVPVDFITNAMVVDYSGGKIRQEIGGRVVTDESAVEMLMLTPQGLVVKNSEVDMKDQERKDRHERWTKWVDAVKANNLTMSQPGGMGEGAGFGRPGGGGP